MPPSGGRGAPWRKGEAAWTTAAKAGFRYVPGSDMRAVCISSHLIPPRTLQADSTVIPLPHCRKLRLETASCPGFNLEHE